MAKKRDDNKTVHVGGNITGDSILGDGNVIHKPTINNNIDGEELGQSLAEAISEREKQARWEKEIHEFQGEDSRQVMETVLVSFISGVGIGGCWQYAFPWNAETALFFVIGTILLFNVLRITHFGLRRSIFKVVIISTAFLLLLKYALFIQAWMDINQFVGSAILAILGALIGLLAGFIQTFWHPLED